MVNDIVGDIHGLKMHEDASMRQEALNRHIGVHERKIESVRSVAGSEALESKIIESR
jgi:hypothetical protein